MFFISTHHCVAAHLYVDESLLLTKALASFEHFPDFLFVDKTLPKKKKKKRIWIGTSSCHCTKYQILFSVIHFASSALARVATLLV